MPPSTQRSAPVTRLRSPVARNRAGGICRVRAARTSSVTASNIDLSTGPGLTALTGMPRRAISLAQVRTKERANLLVLQSP